MQWVMGMLWGPSDIRMIRAQPKRLGKSRGLKQSPAVRAALHIFYCEGKHMAMVKDIPTFSSGPIACVYMWHTPMCLKSMRWRSGLMHRVMTLAISCDPRYCRWQQSRLLKIVTDLIVATADSPGATLCFQRIRYTLSASSCRMCEVKAIQMPGNLSIQSV